MSEVIYDFERVPDEDIPKLLQLLKCEFPRTIHAYSFVETLNKWKIKDPSLNIQILAPNGNFRIGVFFYLISPCDEKDQLLGSLFSWTMDGHRQLVQSLVKYKLDWFKYVITLTCMQEEMWNYVEKPMKDKWPTMRTSHDNVYWLPWNEAKNMKVEKIPDTMYIADLKQENAETIDSLWPHKFPGSKKLLTHVIKKNIGIGLFSRGSGQLISWATEFYYGGIGTVQTLSSYKRKGCATAVVQTITMKMGQKGSDVHLNVVGGNGPADLFFTNIGFRFAFNSVWAITI